MNKIAILEGHIAPRNSFNGSTINELETKMIGSMFGLAMAEHGIIASSMIMMFVGGQNGSQLEGKWRLCGVIVIVDITKFFDMIETCGCIATIHKNSYNGIWSIGRVFCFFVVVVMLWWRKANNEIGKVIQKLWNGMNVDSSWNNFCTLFDGARMRPRGCGI